MRQLLDDSGAVADQMRRHANRRHIARFRDAGGDAPKRSSTAMLVEPMGRSGGDRPGDANHAVNQRHRLLFGRPPSAAPPHPAPPGTTDVVNDAGTTSTATHPAPA